MNERYQFDSKEKIRECFFRLAGKKETESGEFFYGHFYQTKIMGGKANAIYDVQNQTLEIAGEEGNELKEMIKEELNELEMKTNPLN